MTSEPLLVALDKIRRGHIFLVGLPFSDGRPLTFVETAADGNVALRKHPVGFAPRMGSDGEWYSPTFDVVVGHKAKYAVVLQGDSLRCARAD